MKLKLKTYHFTILLTILWSSCAKFLDEDLSGHIPVNNASITSLPALEAALVGTYKPMGHTWVMGYSTAATQAVLMGGDDITTLSDSGSFENNKGPFREFDQYNVSESNEKLEYIWDGAYKAIQGANNVIANYGQVMDNTETVHHNTIKHIAGEAYFLRGFNYFWIVRLWGDAPLVLTSHQYNDSLLNIKCKPPEVIYEQIVSDLLIAETLLDNIKPEPGRVNLGSAKALLASVYLHMAGWPLNETGYYELAALKAKEVIDNKETYDFELLDDFADLWDPTIDDNKEEVFALKFAGDEPWNGNSMFGSAAIPGEQFGWDDYFAEINFFQNFPESYRKEVTFQTEWETTDDNDEPITKSWQEFSSKRPYYAKMQGNGPNHQNALSIPLIRFAEVYLIYAEAQVMATGNTTDPEALNYINQIRRRAHGNPLNEAHSADYRSIAQDSVVIERSLEFAAEFVRWFDIVRLEMVQEVIESRHSTENKDMSKTGYVPYMPIPYSEILANPNLKN